jgi:hypothetical protein
MACHQVNWSFATGETVPGLAARAAALGYRTAAAVSGTTANVLQMGALLGFGGEERVMLRAAMVAWMVPTGDHSILEILLAAEPHMPPPFRMVAGLEDLERLWPPHMTLRASTGETFGGDEVWRSVGRRLARPAGRTLLGRLSDEARAFMQRVLADAGVEEMADEQEQHVEQHQQQEEVAVDSSRLEL